ncbi:MAG: hypothetical protein SA339_11695 [Methanomassiliicoccus sp.]|nr:hypothetical protein [Methanomassiliicoccus sp.]
MPRRFPLAKFTGVGLFVLGSIVLAFSIVGLVPGNQPDEAGAVIFTYLMIDILMLFVATFMVSAGMFFYIYGGSWRGSRELRHRRS